jgi:hypothetical protein
MSHSRILLRPAHKHKVAQLRAALHERSVGERKRSGLFDYPVAPVGVTGWVGADGYPVSVYYDPSLGSDALALAQTVLYCLDGGGLLAQADQNFGLRGLAGNVIIAALDGALDGSTGAYHYGCGYGAGGGDWYVDYAAGNPDEVIGLAVAEIVESYMGIQGRGWNCGGSGGEALSRVLAELATGGAQGAMLPYASGPEYDGGNWIDADQGTDGDYPSIACGVLYLWWMLSLGYTIEEIVQAGEPDGTLASNYAAVTGLDASTAFPNFAAALTAAGGPTSDNPFGGTAPPPPPPPPPPPDGGLDLIFGADVPAGAYRLVPAVPAAKARAKPAPRKGGKA